MTDFLIVLIGLSIQLIFLYWRELLTDKKIIPWIWLGASFLFVFGFSLSAKYGTEMKSLPALMIPLLAYILYRLLHWVYLSIFKQEPVDTFWSMNISLMRSGIFNFLFWFLALIVPAILAFKLLS